MNKAQSSRHKGLSRRKIRSVIAHTPIVEQLPNNRRATARQSSGNCQTIVGQLPDDIRVVHKSLSTQCKTYRLTCHLPFITIVYRNKNYIFVCWIKQQHGLHEIRTNISDRNIRHFYFDGSGYGRDRLPTHTVYNCRWTG